MTQHIKEGLKIIQWNCRSIVENKANSIDFLKGNAADIIILNETWLKSKYKQFKITGYNIIRKDRENKRGGGVAILLTKKLNWTEIKINYNCTNKLETCGVQLSNPDFKIIAIYRPPDTDISTKEWTDFIKQFGNKNIVIRGDCNAHHSL